MTVLQYLLILLGLFEIVSNLFHLSKKTRDKKGASAKRQHQELSLNLPNTHFYHKAIIIFIFGCLFVIAGLLSFFEHALSSPIIWTVTIGFGIYGIVQTIIYRAEIKVWPAMIVYNIPLLIKIFVK